MFHAEKFDKRSAIFPQKGINQNVAPLSMDNETAVYLENFLPFTKGEGTVRYGTRDILKDRLPSNSKIIAQFPSYSPTGQKQIILYVREFMTETGVLSNLIDNHFKVNTNNKAFYQKDFDIQITYEVMDSGDFSESLPISLVVEEMGQNIIVFTGDFVFPENSTLKSLSYPSGSLYCFNCHDLSVTKIKEGLYPHCLPHHTRHKSNLFICNGVDKVQQWNGQTLLDVKGFVEETALDITRTGNNTLTFKASLSFNIENYQNNTVRIVSTKGGSIESLVTNIQNNMGVITLTIADNLPAFDKNGAKLSYLKDVPRFSWMRKLHGRIFALGEGVSGIDYRSPQEAMRVYFQFESNSFDGWFSPTTKSVPYIDLSDTHDILDNLESIAVAGGKTFFMGRKKIQVWSGTEPLGASIAENRPILKKEYDIACGLMHRNLLHALPNDILIANESGIFLLTMGKSITGQFEAISINNMISSFQTDIGSVLTSKKGWDSTISFFYPQSKILMLRLGNNKGMVVIVDSSISSFSTFSGDFQWAGSFLTELDSSLYLSIDNQLYQYADENSGVPEYGDSGGKSLISFVAIFSPFKEKRWSNKYIQLDLEYPSSFLLRENNQLSVSISGNLRQSFSQDFRYNFPMKGDIIGSVPLLHASVYSDDSPEPTEEGQRLDIPYLMPYERVQFCSDIFFVSISGYTNSGKITFKKLNLFGNYGRKV